MKKNIIINGINDESRALYEDLLDHDLNDVVFIDSNRDLVNDLNYKSDTPIAYLGNPISPEFLEFVGINREDKFFIPKKNDSVKKDDKIYVIINSLQMAETLKAFGHEEKISKKIVDQIGGDRGQIKFKPKKWLYISIKVIVIIC